jgi:hypothetical protein
MGYQEARTSASPGPNSWVKFSARVRMRLVSPAMALVRMSSLVVSAAGFDCGEESEHERGDGWTNGCLDWREEQGPLISARRALIMF